MESPMSVQVEAKPYQACLLLVQTFIELLLNADPVLSTPP